MTARNRSTWRFDVGAGATQTMARMRGMVRSAIQREYPVRFSNSVVLTATQRSPASRIAKFRNWFDTWFSYVNDPLGVELLREPETMMRDVDVRGFAQGDCDDAAMLAATFALANGMPARFRALAFAPGGSPFEHVLTDVYDGARWQPVDPTKPVNMRVPPKITGQLIVGV